MPHTNQLVDEFGKRGFTVVGVTGEPKGPTEKYLESTGAKMAVIFEPGLASMKEFGFGGFPSSALINPKGKVVWTGHPAGLTAKIIEKNIAGARTGLRPGSTLSVEAKLPKKWSGVAKKLAKGKLGAGLKALEKAIDKGAAGYDGELLGKALETVRSVLKGTQESASSAYDEGRFADAEANWELIKKHFAGHPAAKEASNKIRDLKKNKEIALELDAGRRIRKAMNLSNAGKTKKAIKALKALIKTGRLSQTKEASRAKTLLEELVSDG